MSKPVIFIWQFPPRGPTAAGHLREFPGIRKGKEPCLKGERGLKKKESKVILRKIGSLTSVRNKLGQVPYASSMTRYRSPPSPTRLLTNLYKILPKLPVFIAESHVNASGLNFDILFLSIRRASDSGKLRTGEGFEKYCLFKS